MGAPGRRVVKIRVPITQDKKLLKIIPSFKNYGPQTFTLLSYFFLLGMANIISIFISFVNILQAFKAVIVTPRSVMTATDIKK